MLSRLLHHLFAMNNKHVMIRDSTVNEMQRSLPWFLGYLKNLKAADDCDYFYGVLGLANNISISPDYSLSTIDAYQTTTHSIIEQSRSLEIVARALLIHKRVGLPPGFRIGHSQTIISHLGRVHLSLVHFGVFSPPTDRIQHGLLDTRMVFCHLLVMKFPRS